MVSAIHRFTTLGRVIDLRYRSNRAISFVAIIAGAAGFFAIGPGDQAPGLASAFALGGGAVLAWALGRELDPDEPASALVASLLAIAVVFWLGPGQLLVLFGLVAIARILLRSVGPPPTLFDLVVLVGLGAVLGTRPGGWPVALVLAFAVARDRTLPGEPARFGRVAALLLAALSTGLAVVSGVGEWAAPTGAEWAVALAGIVAGLMIKPVQPMSPTDLGGMVLLGRRLSSARRITLAALVLAIVLAGSAGLAAVGGGFATFAAVFLVQRRIVPVGAGPETPETPGGQPEWAGDA